MRLALATFLILLGCSVNRFAMPEDRFIDGRLVRVERDERYESSCGLISRLLGCTDSPRAYQATVIDSAHHQVYFFMFAFAGDSIPSVGTYALWHLHRREVFLLGQYHPYRTPSEIAYTLDSDRDVRRP